MRKIRIYQTGSYHVGQSIELSPDAGQHVGVVLRMKPQEEIILFSGDNREFTAILNSVNKKKVTVTIKNERQISRESPRSIHLAQALSKGERMEFVVQKAVELGVASIHPIITTRSVVKLGEERLEKKRLQWQAIAIAACEQSGRNCIPTVYPAVALTHYLQKLGSELKLVLDLQGAKTWRDYPFGQSAISLLIGPEGGFAPDELQEAFVAGFNPLCLGPRILRTETAALAALSILQAVCGDL